MSEKQANFGPADRSLFDRLRQGPSAQAENQAAPPPVDFGPADPNLFRRQALQAAPEVRAVPPPEAVLPAEATGPEAAPGPPRVERPPETPSQTVEAVVAQEAQEVLQEKVQASELSPEEKRRLEKIINNKNFLDKAAEFAYKKLKGEKFAGIPLDFAVSFAGTTAVRLATRKVLESAFSITGGAVTGAIIGAGFRGFREWRKAVKEQYSATSWLKELEGKDGVELAETYEAVKQAIDEAKVKGNQEEARGLVLKLRDVEAKIKTAGVDVKKEPETAVRKVLGSLEQVMGNTELEGKRKDLYKIMLNSRRLKVLGKTAEGAAVGAAIGAGAGVLAEYAAEQIKDWFEGGKEAGEAAAAAKQRAAEELAQKVEEAEQAAMAKSVQKGIEELPEKIFTMRAQAGEGLTHIARNAIHDYLVQLNGYGMDPIQEMKLDQAQLVYAEDWLRRQLEHEELVKLGEPFKIKGSQIAEALSRSQRLSGEELGNLKVNWVGKISEKVWGRIMDYSQPFNEANNFAQVVHEKAIAAGEQTAAQVEKATEAVAAGAQKAAEEKAGEAVEEVGRTAKEENTLKYIIGGVLGIGAAGFAAYRYREKLGSTFERAKAVAGTAVSQGRETLGGAFGRTKEAIRQRMRPAQESRAAAAATPEQKGKVKEGEVEKLAADPVLQFVETRGFKPKQGDIGYAAIVPGDLGKDKAGSLRFSNYSDFRAHLERMSAYQRARALQYSNTGLLATGGFWKKVDGLPEEDQKKWEQLRQQINSGRAEDIYAGKPEVKPVTRTEAETRKNNLEREYGIDLYRDFYADDDGNDYAFVRLAEVLAKLPKERLKAKKFQPSLNNSLGEDGIIKFNPDAKPEELQEFLTREGLDKADKIADLDKQADQMIYELYRIKSGLKIVPMVHGEKYLRAATALKEAVQSLEFPLEFSIFLFDPATREASDKYLYLSYDLSPEEMRAVIEKYLTQQASKENK